VRMRRCRKALGLHVDDVRDACIAFALTRGTPRKLHRQSVYRWEWGLTPELLYLEAIADLYSASLDWLVRGEGAAPAYLQEGGTCLSA
jgi:hypothetical protein